MNHIELHLLIKFDDSEKDINQLNIIGIYPNKQSAIDNMNIIANKDMNIDDNLILKNIPKNFNFNHEYNFCNIDDDEIHKYIYAYYTEEEEEIKFSSYFAIIPVSL